MWRVEGGEVGIAGNVTVVVRVCSGPVRGIQILPRRLMIIRERCMWSLEKEVIALEYRGIELWEEGGCCSWREASLSPQSLLSTLILRKPMDDSKMLS